MTSQAKSQIENNTDLSGDYPAVNAAFSFVVPSYQFMAGRFEAADNRLTALLSLVATLSLAAPALGRAVDPGIRLDSGWFVAAMALFLAATAVGLRGRFAGRLWLPDPLVHFKKSLHRSDWEFKKNCIAYAGEHFNDNVAAVELKGLFAFGVSVLLALEIVCLALWIGSSRV